MSDVSVGRDDERRGAHVYNATVDLLERNLLPGRADRPYLRTHERTWSYREVAEGADAAGAGLLALGLGPGDRVLLATGDRPEFVITFWGAMKAGLIPVPVPPGLSTSGFRFILSDSEARAVVCDGASASSALAALEGGTAICLLVDADVPDPAIPWAEVCGRCARLEPAPTHADDIAMWLYTSGTSGVPKAVMHRHRHLRDVPGGLSEQVVRMGPEDVILSIPRMFFAYGLGNSVYLPAAAGASAVVAEGPSFPSVVQELLEAMSPTLVFGVPSSFAGFARLADAHLPGSVRMVISSADSLPADVFEAFRTRFHVPLLDGLGSTEALHHVTSNLPEDVVAGSVGRPLAGYEVRVLNQDQQPVPEGAMGDLWIKGPTTFAGYWRRPELTVHAYADGWMRTGDLARVVDGRVFHEGRVDDMIKLGGLWVAPREIEDVLRTHPDVTDAAVVAVDEGTGVPYIRALIASERDDPGLSQELARICRSRLARFEVPRSFEVHELPRTPSGNVSRYLLRDAPGAGVR
jgi:benzoate-CoA ligase family protein